MTYKYLPKDKQFLATNSVVQIELSNQAHTMVFQNEVDLTNIERIISEHQSRGKRLTYTAFTIMATTHAMREFPYTNRRVFKNFFTTRQVEFKNIDAAVLIERDIPGKPMSVAFDIIRSADNKSLDEIAIALENMLKPLPPDKKFQDYSGLIKLPSFVMKILVRALVSSPKIWAKYRGGAFCVSSPAKYGVDVITGMWTWPLGTSFGFAKKRPIVVTSGGESKIEIRPTFIFTLNWDRRLMAGAQAAKFFHKIIEYLENPELIKNA